NGRIVYGGGGIMPDVFVPRDTTDITPYFTKLVNKALIYKFALKYTEAHRSELKKYTDWQSLNTYLNTQGLFNQLVAYAEKENITGSNKDKDISRSLINEHINSYIVRNILGDEGFYPLLYTTDETVLKALSTLNSK
ncbi:MAG: peptidase S41, partial [Paludibacteraceae bacterium]|nr:peptidase S41 [Paludibacteraceae bacterium]